MDVPLNLRNLAKTLFHLRIPSTRAHLLLAWEYKLRTLGLSELARVLYFQPMFEAMCAQVGPHCRLELCPDSKLPVIGNVDLELGAHVHVSARTTFAGARNAKPRAFIRIGDHGYVGTRCVLRSGKGLTIGRNALIGSNSLISSDPGHPMDPVTRRTQAAPPEALEQMVIGDDVWICPGAAVLGGVRIGDGAVVGTNAVVVKDVPPYALVVGNPARVVKFLDGRPVPGRDPGVLPVPQGRPAEANAVRPPAVANLPAEAGLP